MQYNGTAHSFLCIAPKYCRDQRGGCRARSCSAPSRSPYSVSSQWGGICRHCCRFARCPLLRTRSAFTRHFDPRGQPSTHLNIGGIEGRIVASPLFPYATLDTSEVVEGSCEWLSERGHNVNLSTEARYINRDRFWNVFWVEVYTCPAPTRFFGPFRLLEQ